MKAMIFAAGIGSRLKPFTNKKPKALLPVQGKPLLQHNLERLIQFGITDFVINVHHFAEQIIDFLKKHNNFGVNINISDESDRLLDTGGGLQKAKPLLRDSETIILQNADIITNIDYRAMIDFHDKNKAIATLAVQSRTSSRYLRFNSESVLCGWENVKTNSEIASRECDSYTKCAFNGIHIINRQLLEHLNLEGDYGIIKIYLELAKTLTILGYKHDSDYWFDVGTPEKVSALNVFLERNKNK